MNFNTPKWINHHVKISLESNESNDVVLIIQWGPLTARITIESREFLDLLTKIAGEMGDEWKIVDHMVKWHADHLDDVEI